MKYLSGRSEMDMEGVSLKYLSEGIDMTQLRHCIANCIGHVSFLLYFKLGVEFVSVN